MNGYDPKVERFSRPITEWSDTISPSSTGRFDENPCCLAAGRVEMGDVRRATEEQQFAACAPRSFCAFARGNKLENPSQLNVFWKSLECER